MKFEEDHFDAHNLLRRVYTHLYDVNRINTQKRNPTTFDRICLERLNIEVRGVDIKKGRWVQWNKPDEHDLKLNIDGACTGHTAAGGGLVRDKQGDFVFGFSNPYEHEDALGADIQALYDGLVMCRDQRLARVCVEVDAAMVINMLKDDVDQVYWKYAYLIRQVKGILPGVGNVNLIVREQNKAADFLAKIAVGGNSKHEFHSIDELPRSLQKIIFLDRIGIPNFRSLCN